jgi:CheY-like chemotaxis protein
MTAQVSVWPSVSASWSGITAGSGSNQNPDADQSSASRSPSDNTQTRRPWHILIAEDNKSDVVLIQRALKKSGVDAQVHIADDGEKAVRFFERADSDTTAPCLDLILLDINMPRYKGGDILRKLRSSSRCKNALVLIVTSSDSSRDREEMDTLGAHGYFRKPSEFSEFMKLGLMVRDLLERKDRHLT